MFSSARLALRRSLVAAPRAASLGAGFRQATEEPYPRRLLHGQLLPRLISSDASGSNKHSPPSGFIEKHKELQQVRQEYHAKTQVNVHNTYNGVTMSKTAGAEKFSNFGGSLPFAASRTFNEHKQFSRKKKKDFVHVLLKGNKTFVTVTDARGNKKTGASAGCLEDRKGFSICC